MVKKIAALMISAAFVLCIGIGVAYYNTTTFGFDEDAKVISRDDEKISILDYEIYYNDINKIIGKASEYIPDTHNIVFL
ncbi:MAG: hypothetical protein NC397_07390 [Clostridium sp.]|nr:hypothetical protein [Clostridium sp.]